MSSEQECFIPSLVRFIRSNGREIDKDPASGRRPTGYNACVTPVLIYAGTQAKYARCLSYSRGDYEENVQKWRSLYVGKWA